VTGALVTELVRAGRLTVDDGRIHSTGTTPQHPLLVQALEKPHALLAEVRVAAVCDGALDGRIATLLALAGPCQMLEVVAPERVDRKVAKRRIKEAAEGVPAAAAVKYVIDAMAVAVVVATSAVAAG